MKSAILGTRGSPLALAQTEIIRRLLTKAHPPLRIEVKIIKTSGDQFNSLSLTTSGGKGLFTKEIEEQLLRGEIHLAVHSMKDLPTMLPDGLTIGAVPPREDARDVFVSKRYSSLDELPEGARVATSSIRRRAQLLARRPDLQVEEIRGNVGTRLQKLADNKKLDAVILAAAGLKRLGLWDGKTNHVVVGADSIRDLSRPRLQTAPTLPCAPLATDVIIPAVGQGIIACEVRGSDLETQELVAAINHADTLACAEAERIFLRALGGGCQVPYAAHATVNAQQMKLIGAKFSPDGKDFSKTEAVGQRSDPHELGARAAKQVL
jgi:porphobilinogen deaminase